MGKESLNKQESLAGERIELLSAEQIKAVLQDATTNLNVDFTGVPVEAISPASIEFTFLELFPALRIALKDVGETDKLLLIIRGYRHHPDNALLMLKNLAKRFAISETGELPGFIYTVMEEKIVFPTFPEYQAIDLAEKYARKEQNKIAFINEAAAIEYLRNLANKYLYHELGHLVYAKIPLNIKQQWLNFISSNAEILSRVKEVQAGNINDSIPISTQANEAFADIFVPIASADKYNNRLGNFTAERLYIEKILLELGFTINKSK